MLLLPFVAVEFVVVAFDADVGVVVVVDGGVVVDAGVVVVVVVVGVVVGVDAFVVVFVSSLWLLV